jgi:hypothetical protein
VKRFIIRDTHHKRFVYIKGLFASWQVFFHHRYFRRCTTYCPSVLHFYPSWAPCKQVPRTRFLAPMYVFILNLCSMKSTRSNAGQLYCCPEVGPNGLSLYVQQNGPFAIFC